MADCSNEPVWNPDALEVTRVDDGPLAPGAEWDGRYKGMGTMRVRLDEYERPKRLRLTTTGNKMDMQWTFDYSSAGESRTHVEAHAEIQPKGAMRLMAPLMGPMIKGQVLEAPGAARGGSARHTAEGHPAAVLKQDQLVKIYTCRASAHTARAAPPRT